MKTQSRRMDIEPDERFKSGVWRPLIEVSKDECRDWLQRFEARSDRGQLSPARHPQESKVHAYDAKLRAISGNIENQRAARLNSRKVKRVPILDNKPGPQKKCIAVPPDTGLVSSGIGREQISFICNQVGRQRGGALSKPFVGFL